MEMISLKSSEATAFARTLISAGFDLVLLPLYYTNLLFSSSDKWFFIWMFGGVILGIWPLFLLLLIRDNCFISLLFLLLSSDDYSLLFLAFNLGEAISFGKEKRVVVL